MRSFRLTLAVGSLGLCCLVGSCDFVYQPQQFVVPPPEFTFVPLSTMQNFVGTSNVKIAFCHSADGSVYYVDYNDPTLTVKKLRKPAGYSGNSNSPLLSPDGKWVTYFIKSSNTSCVGFVQLLDPNADAVKLPGSFSTDPHWWIDPVTKLSYIIYSDLYIQDDLSTTTGHATFKLKVDLSNGTTPVLAAAPDTLAPKPMNGGLSKDGRYLCTGYNEAAFFNVAAGAVIPINVAGTNIEQVCNPSMSPDTAADSSIRMMFLCFGGTQNLFGMDTIGTVNAHQYIFIVDTTNTVQWYINKPAEYADIHDEWEDPEWSNQSDFAAATLGDVRVADSYDGVIIRRHDKSVLKVMTSGTIEKMDNESKPYVWIGQ